MNKILIVDDENAVRISILDFLLDYGYDVTPAVNGKDALEKFSKNEFDLILTDISMPKIDGYELIKEIKKKKSRTPIIVISGLNRITDALDALNYGAWDYLTKPIINFDILIHAIKKNLEKAELIKENDNYKIELENKIKQRTRELLEKNNELLFEIEKTKQAEKKINEYKESLEILVEERTKQLKNTNKRLNYMITKQTRIQKELVESEKFAALGELVAGIAHEINTPVGVAVTASSFITEKVKTLKENKDLSANNAIFSTIKVINESALLILNNLRRASQLIKSFKNIAVDQSSDNVRIFDLEDYLNDIILSLKPKLKKTKHEINIKFNQPLKLKTMPGVFSQIFTNLIMNSIIHGFENIENGKISIKINTFGEIVLIEYKDNGNGISKKNISKIFEPFFTTKRNKGGSGLGLNLVYNLVVQKLNGEIIVESNPDKQEGTIFLMKFKNSENFSIIGENKHDNQ